MWVQEPSEDFSPSLQAAPGNLTQSRHEHCTHCRFVSKLDIKPATVRMLCYAAMLIRAIVLPPNTHCCTTSKKFFLEYNHLRHLHYKDIPRHPKFFGSNLDSWIPLGPTHCPLGVNQPHLLQNLGPLQSSSPQDVHERYFLSLRSNQPPHLHYSTSVDISVLEDSSNMLLSKHPIVQTDSLLLYLQNQVSQAHPLRLHCLFRGKHCSAPCRPPTFTNAGDYLIHPLPILQVPIPPGPVVTQPI